MSNDYNYIHIRLLGHSVGIAGIQKTIVRNINFNVRYLLIPNRNLETNLLVNNKFPWKP